VPDRPRFSASLQVQAKRLPALQPGCQFQIQRGRVLMAEEQDNVAIRADRSGAFRGSARTEEKWRKGHPNFFFSASFFVVKRRVAVINPASGCGI
jgi:hypothetical protein